MTSRAPSGNLSTSGKKARKRTVRPSVHSGSMPEHQVGKTSPESKELQGAAEEQRKAAEEQRKQRKETTAAQMAANQEANQKRKEDARKEEERKKWEREQRLKHVDLLSSLHGTSLVIILRKLDPEICQNYEEAGFWASPDQRLCVLAALEMAAGLKPDTPLPYVHGSIQGSLDPYIIAYQKRPKKDQMLRQVPLSHFPRLLAQQKAQDEAQAHQAHVTRTFEQVAVGMRMVLRQEEPCAGNAAEA